VTALEERKSAVSGTRVAAGWSGMLKTKRSGVRISQGAPYFPCSYGVPRDDLIVVI